MVKKVFPGANKRFFKPVEKRTLIISKSLQDSNHDFVQCSICGKNITHLLATYKSCIICGKPILNECDICHYSEIHKDFHVEIKIKITKNIYEPLSMNDAVTDIEKMERLLEIGCWTTNYTK